MCELLNLDFGIARVLADLFSERGKTLSGFRSKNDERYPIHA